MNKGWPSLLWFLCNYDGDQAGSYFGAQEANRTLHAIYALDNGTVTLDNLSNTTQSGLSVESKVYNLAGTVLDDQTASNISLTSQQVRDQRADPEGANHARCETYFVELQLKQNGTLVDRNVYWLSTQQDVVELEQDRSASRRRDLSLREPHRPGVAAAVVGHRHRQHRQPGRAGRGGPGDHGHHHQHVRIDGRVPAPGRYAPRRRHRPGTGR